MDDLDELLVYTSILAASALMLQYTLTNLSGNKAIFPVFVFTVTGVGVLVRLGGKVVALGGEAPEDDDEETGLLERLESGNNDVSGYRTLRMVGWAILFVSIIYVVGFVLGIPIILFVFFAIESPLSPVKSAVIAALLTVLIVVTFQYLLNLPLYEGII